MRDFGCSVFGAASDAYFPAPDAEHGQDALFVAGIEVLSSRAQKPPASVIAARAAVPFKYAVRTANICNDIVAIFKHLHASKSTLNYLQLSANKGFSPDSLQIICNSSTKLKGRTEFVRYFRPPQTDRLCEAAYSQLRCSTPKQKAVQKKRTSRPLHRRTFFGCASQGPRRPDGSTVLVAYRFAFNSVR